MTMLAQAADGPSPVAVLAIVGIVLMLVLLAAWMCVRPQRRAPMGSPVICPNPHCGYRGATDRRAKGSTLTLLILFALGVLPGVLYLVLCGGYVERCPRCRMQVASTGL